MLAHANNHTFDYGASGVLETIAHVEGEGLIIAGSGKDLQNARAPRYFQCAGGAVALVAMASDFVPYGKASRSRPDVHGRPGVNPLAIARTQTVQFRPLEAASRSRIIGGLLHRVPGLTDLTSLKFSISWKHEPVSSDLNANLDVISEAASNADIVVVSVHAHRQGRWLRNFAHQAIERGARVVLVHGPHHIGGIELYRGTPIFYSMGDFAYEAEFVSRFPAEAYEQLGLAADASISELAAARGAARSGLLRDRRAFEGFAALISSGQRRVKRVLLLPIDLRFDSVDGSRGRPHAAPPRLGSQIIKTVADRSRKFGTRIHYDAKENLGEVIFR
jgi:poly-gamma-glutamate synthesis protein (capsule biosynthesis protein)